MVRAPFYDKNGIKKGAWSSEEDEKLRAYVERYGHWNWRELPKYAGLSRCGKSCRLRWMNYLRPDVKRGNYTAEEENIIINLHEEHGNKWSLIAANLPGRTDNEIKNYWHTHLKKRTSHKTPTTSQTDQDQSCEWSHECDQITSHGNGETEAESSNLDNNHAELSPTILESSQSPSDMSTYSSEPSFLISHTSDQSDTNYSYENNNITNNYLYSSLDQAFYEEYSTGTDFWTKPFMEDKMTSQNDDQYPTTCFGDGGNSSLYLSLYDDGMEYFYYH